MTKELKQQYTLKITQANKTQLVVILYEMLLVYIEDAEKAHGNGDRSGFRSGIRKAEGCLRELMASLHFEYEPAMNLLQLYLYANRELAKADIRNSVEELQHVKMVMNKLHDAYEKLSEQDVSGPVMANTQTVYAGLTYGKNSLTESLADQGSNRGFRV
ncbi:flagellar export chaperone FliS [Parablautia muri]|uniref:Flagellar protein FliS n=1 Tax=Parablautia muri TaxID=2320879 RepID=A0A9X5BI52_9FIRM|nr:flagellar protein FliS [Parablautia muri]NBJ94198.1 flagellar protein FliS [Parablautia muri]